VEEARKWRIPLSFDGTDQSGPQLVAQMRGPASAGAKAQHAEVGHDIELRRSEGRSLVWLFRWSLDCPLQVVVRVKRNAIPRRALVLHVTSPRHLDHMIKHTL
jgi:hypothetical protein